MERTDADIIVVGAGAAGLFASIWAARSAPSTRVIALDGATKLGAKILVAGGGRCNVTHHRVSERDYHGSTPHAIRKVLTRFDVPHVIDFFREQGVELKREDTGKLFPVSDDARSVLNALMNAAGGAGVRVIHPWRVRALTRERECFVVERVTHDGPNEHASDLLRARRVILATGGKSLPRTGSDGAGYELARSLGHTITPRVFPALVPLRLEDGHWLCALSGVSLPVELTLRRDGHVVTGCTGPMLLTHFGFSGPAVLDISRSWIGAGDPARPEHAPVLSINFLPGQTTLNIEDALKDAGRTGNRVTLLAWLTSRLPERLARAILTHAQVDPSSNPSRLSADTRRRIALLLTDLRPKITGDRGWLFAEATAGGVPLSELHLDTLESRVCPGLHLCGEVLDVDGRLGGFNFQWAWASGFVAGTGSAARCPHQSTQPQ